MKNKTPPWWTIFAIHFLKTNNATQSYKLTKPHVSDKSASSQSCKLLLNPDFSKVLEEERSKLIKAINLSRDEWISELIWVAKARPEKIEAGAKLRALEILGNVLKHIPIESEKGGTQSEEIVKAFIRISQLPKNDDMPIDVDSYVRCKLEGEE
jgi:hypothetical protein